MWVNFKASFPSADSRKIRSALISIFLVKFVEDAVNFNYLCESRFQIIFTSKKKIIFKSYAAAYNTGFHTFFALISQEKQHFDSLTSCNKYSYSLLFSCGIETFLWTCNPRIVNKEMEPDWCFSLPGMRHTIRKECVLVNVSFSFRLPQLTQRVKLFWCRYKDWDTHTWIVSGM